MTAAQDGQADVREAVARWSKLAELREAAEVDGPWEVRWDCPDGEHHHDYDEGWIATEDGVTIASVGERYTMAPQHAELIVTVINSLPELLAVVGQASRADEAAATPEQIIAQRAKGWPDFHPETYCHRCGRPNVRAWYAPGDLWNQVMPDDGIVCPQCFAVQAERVLGDVTGWRLTPRRRGELDDKELRAKLLDLADGYDVDSCDPMPVAASRMLLAVAEKLRAAARG